MYSTYSGLFPYIHFTDIIIPLGQSLRSSLLPVPPGHRALSGSSQHNSPCPLGSRDLWYSCSPPCGRFWLTGRLQVMRVSCQIHVIMLVTCFDSASCISSKSYVRNWEVYSDNQTCLSSIPSCIRKNYPSTMKSNLIAKWSVSQKTCTVKRMY